MYVCMYVCLFVCLLVRTYVRLYVCMPVCTYCPVLSCTVLYVCMHASGTRACPRELPGAFAYPLFKLERFLCLGRKLEVWKQSSLADLFEGSLFIFTYRNESFRRLAT